MTSGPIDRDGFWPPYRPLTAALENGRYRAIVRAYRRRTDGPDGEAVAVVGPGTG